MVHRSDLESLTTRSSGARVRCLGRSSLAAAAVCAFLATSGYAEDEEAELIVLVLAAHRDYDETQIRSLAATGRLFVVGPVDLAADALRAGASGYTTIATPPGELLAGLAAVAGGRRGLGSDVVEALIAQATPGRTLVADELSEHQRHVLGRLCAGAVQKEIAAELGVSRQAVTNTLGRLRTRAGVATNADLARLARDQRLLEPA